MRKSKPGADRTPQKMIPFSVSHPEQKLKRIYLDLFSFGEGHAVLEECLCIPVESTANIPETPHNYIFPQAIILSHTSSRSSALDTIVWMCVTCLVASFSVKPFPHANAGRVSTHAGFKKIAEYCFWIQTVDLVAAEHVAISTYARAHARAPLRPLRVLGYGRALTAA